VKTAFIKAWVDVAISVTSSGLLLIFAANFHSKA